MAALVDGQYELNSYRQSSPSATSAHKTIVHVKLTDSAYRALEEFQKIKDATSRRPTLQFDSNTGIIRVPIKKSSDNPEGLRPFRISLSSIQTDPNGSFDCIWQPNKSRPNLETKGTMSHKIAVHATDEVYQTTREKMTKAEVESKKFCAKEIKPSGPHISRRIKRVVKGGEASSSSAGRSNHHSHHHGSNSSSSGSSSLPHKVPGSGSQHQQNGAIQQQPHSKSSSTHNSSSKPHNFPVHNKTTPTPSHHQRLQAHSPQSTNNHSVSGAVNSSANAPSRHSPHQSAAATTQGRCSPNPAVFNLPYRDRIVHLLALRPYKKPELLARLQRDGVKDRDKNAFTSILTSVAHFNPRDNSYTLLKHLYGDVRPDFPGYTETDRQLLKRRTPEPAVQSAGNSPAISPTHSHGSTGSSPGGSQKRPTSTTETDELTFQPASKKQRISHERQRELRQEAVRMAKSIADPVPGQSPTPKSPTTKSPKTTALTTSPSPNNSPVEVSTTTPDTVLQPKVKEYLKAQNNNNNTDKQHLNHSAKFAASSTSVTPDYLLQYKAIQNENLRQQYKRDFNSEYEEYRQIHKSINSVTKRFKELEMSLRKQEEGSDDYENIKNMILNEYRNVRKDPTYVDNRKRCDYLHKKLGHIKKLILEYDQAQLMQS